MTRSASWRHFRLPLAAGACLATLSAVALGVLPQQQGTVDLLTQANVTLNGAAAYDYSGGSVASAGDVNGDGLADVIVGASDADPSSRTNAGSSYVIYGTASPSNVNLASLGSSGFRIDGAAAGDGSGSSVASAGDVNGDGRADVIVGAPAGGPSWRDRAGSSYVIYGTASPSNVNLASLGSSSGFRIDGAADLDYSGNSVASAGDVNGDGRADVIVGAPSASPSSRSGAGSSYVIYGTASPSNVDLASLGSSGFRIDGAADSDYSGGSVASAGDVNGDGRADVIVGAPSASPSSRSGAGSSYVIYGTASPSDVDLSLPLGSSGFRIDGAADSDYSGGSVASAGDVNGDGRADVIVGAPSADPSLRDDAGSSYVIYGTASPSDVDLSLPLGSNGFRIDGAADLDYSGRSVASAGDVNGDGLADVIVGAPYADPSSRRNAGSSYVIYGFGTASVSYPGAITATVGTSITSITPTVRRTGTATFSVSPALPAGLSLDTATGVISGTPTEVATATSTVTMTDLSGTATTTVSVAVAAPPADTPPADTPPAAAPTPAAAPAAESPVLTETGGTSTTATPSVHLSQSQRRNGIPVSRDGDVRITLQCPVGGAACVMTGTFTSTSPACRSGMSLVTTTTLGSFRNVRVPAGSTKAITVRLFPTPLHYLQANGVTTIGAVLTVRRTLGSAITSSSQKVRLRIPRVHMAVTG
ncbi:MAG: FG-GAP-like repeat-containing protein [Actinobacteria bacterium]|nr:FG-GAP-like repeat-containing protein [Actinomycetota bacterium]